ncbi:MAG: YhdP family protein [Betaproteobacteria bacterium]
MQTQSGTDASSIEAGVAPKAGAARDAHTRTLPRWVRGVRHLVGGVRLFLRSVELLLWAAFFLVAITFLALRYWVLPNVERYRPAIVAAVSAAAGRPVTVERISADWRGLRPQLELVNVRVFDEGGREALVLPSVVNVIAWSSLAFLDLRLHSFEVDNLKLSVRREPDGRISVAGIVLDPQKKGNGRLTDWVLGQREIVVRNSDIVWQDEMRHAPPLRLANLNFRLQNDGDEHSAGFFATPPPGLGTSVEVRAELIGPSVTQPSEWNGRLFAEVGNTDLAAWRAWLDYPVDVHKGDGAVRVWATLAGGKVRRVAADLALSGLEAQVEPELPVLQLAGVQGRLSWRHTPTGFELGSRELRFNAIDGAQMQPTTLRLVLERATGARPAQGTFKASRLEFAPIARIAGSLPFPADVRKLLGELAPQGVMQEAQFNWVGELPQPATYVARGRFEGLGMNARGRVPGFSGLSGSLDADEKRGTLRLAARDAVIDLPKVFRDPRTQFDSLSGQVSWESLGASNSGAAAPHFKLAGLAFSNAAFAGTASGTYALTGQGPGTIDLSAQLTRADARQVARYAPLVLSEGLRSWLASAIVAGSSNDVRLRLRGDLFDFPFANPAKGEFKVAAKVHQGVLDYVQGWPRMEGIDADLVFERERAEVVGRRATIFGTTLTGVRVSIPNMGAGLINISGQADGPTTDFLRYTQQSPVRRMISGATDAMQASGRGQLKLKLDLPLGDLSKSKVAGQYQFNANNVLVDPRLPQVERATGRVEFSEGSLAIRDVRGALFGGPVSIAGGTRPEGGVAVTARGDATVAGIRSVFDHPWRRFLSGGAPYSATVIAAEGKVRVAFESSLAGVTSELPVPLAKGAQETLPLRVEIVPVDNGDRISVTLGKFVNAEFQRRREGDALVVQRTGVGLNQPTRLPERNGLMLAGTLPALSLDSWLPLIGSASGPDTPAAGASGPAGAVAAPGPAPAPSASTFDLKLGTLDAFGKRLHAVALRAGAQGSGWQANISANEMAGDLSYSGEGRGKLTARLAHFTPPGESPSARQGGSGDLPAVDLVAERFNYRGKQLGRVEVVAKPEGANWRIEKVANVNPEAAMTASGLWVTGANSRTSIDFMLNVNDTGKYLDRVGTPDSVKGGTAKLTGALAWSGDPLNIDYPSLAGTMTLLAESGQFLEIEPGIGKLVSLMSLQMLPRRIALDFRDVFSKGFAYDKITSSLTIDKGVIDTKDFKMRGPAAEVDIVGTASLAKETQNLHVKVVPALGDTASTIVGLLNPVYGVATLLAQKLLKNPLGNIFAFEYAVSGTWTDPKVEKLRVVPLESSPGGGMP